MTPLALYSDVPVERTRWILENRGPKNLLDPSKPYAALLEDEIGPDGALWPCATLFLTNRECPFRCLMCDLWKNTLSESLAPGAIPAQIDAGLAEISPFAARNERLPEGVGEWSETGGGRHARAVKLYNSGSFFDPNAISPEDDDEIARRVRGFERVIVECHTAFLMGKHRERVLKFRDAIAPATLEIAIGLETAHEGVLEKLNKRMTLADFREASAWLRSEGIALRVFILVRPPFLTEEEGRLWACRSLDVAAECGATLAALIPVRAGNGAMEVLREAGLWEPPTLQSVEAALEYGQALSPRNMRVVADLWDISLFVTRPGDDARIARIAARNVTFPGVV
jgi:archaeosine synthase beta-subunit